jgi:hypothetical protein
MDSARGIHNCAGMPCLSICASQSMQRGEPGKAGSERATIDHRRLMAEAIGYWIGKP